MELTFLGIGAAFNPAMDNSNAFFSYKKEFFLLDCGETTFGKIYNLKEFVEAEQISVMVTHLHCDHVGSLASLISYCYYVLNKPVLVVHPLDTIVKLLSLMGIKRENYTYKTLYPNTNEVYFEPIEVDHVPDMRCFGYVVQAGSLSFYYSGDAISIPQSVLERFRSKEIEHIYQDTSLEKSNHPTHGSLADLEGIFSLEERARVFCMHLDSDFRPLLKEKGFGLITLLSSDLVG